jgi:hypothetical protein
VLPARQENGCSGGCSAKSEESNRSDDETLVKPATGTPRARFFPRSPVQIHCRSKATPPAIRLRVYWAV